MNKFPNIAVDVVLFSYFENNLNVLLIKRNIEPYRGKYALPGVLLREHETTDEAAVRLLYEEANIDIDYLEQLYTFSDVDRDPRNRIISVTYYGLVNENNYNISKDHNASEIGWYNTNQDSLFSTTLAFDHYKIFKYALNRLKIKIQYEPIGLDLLPNYFTLGELHKLYSIVLGKDIDRRNFSRKILSYNLLTKTNFKNTNTVGRRGQLYEFNKDKYNELKKRGINFEI